MRQQLEAQKSQFQKLKDFGKENRYPIVGVSWLASMGIALALVGRNPYLTTSQKIVQARVYAQGLTLAVLVATAAFEIGDKNQGEGRWETVKVLDPDDPEHKHMINKRIHHESYAGEDLWRGESLSYFVYSPLKFIRHGRGRGTENQRAGSRRTRTRRKRCQGREDQT